MNLKEKVKMLCDERGISVSKLERELGISSGNVKHWDVSVPSGDKILALSRYFNIKPGYFLTDDDEPEYYIDPAVVEIAQELKENPNFKLLFNASKDMTEEDIKFVIDMIERMK